MYNRSERGQTTKAQSPSRDNSIVNYENLDEREDSKLQVLFSNVIGKGNYKNPSNYKEVHALLLCWEEKSGDLLVKPEVEKLKSVFEDRFRYKAQIEYLDNSIAPKLQLRVNRLVATFVDENDGPNNLLIVYYAGHGRPGGSYGSLVLHASIKAERLVYPPLIITDKLRQTTRSI